MTSLLKTFLRALTRACVELIESESGEFLTTREKGRLLDAMMREQRERKTVQAAAPSGSNEPPLTARHIQSA
jgi:hypothetical protein